MKKLFKRITSLLTVTFLGMTALQAQNAPLDMDRFVDALLKRMTVDEKIGQLNLPVTGEIVTGQAKSSDIAGKIKRGEVGGVLNLTGVERIRDVQKLAVENSRLGIPLIFGLDVIHGYETIFPIPLGLSCTWDMKSIEESALQPSKPVLMVSPGLSVRWWISAVTLGGDVSVKVPVRILSLAHSSHKPW